MYKFLGMSFKEFIELNKWIFGRHKDDEQGLSEVIKYSKENNIVYDPTYTTVGRRHVLHVNSLDTIIGVCENNA